MAILNDKNQLISYACPELVADLQEDCREFRRSKTVYAACRVQEGVKIVFDYAFDPKDPEEMKDFPTLKEDEWLEKTTLGKLLAYATQLNNATNEYKDLNELFDASGMSLATFAKYLSIPRRTVQDWLCGSHKPADYIVKLIQCKLTSDGII